LLFLFNNKKNRKNATKCWKKGENYLVLPGPPGQKVLGPGTFEVSRSCPARTTGPLRSLGPVLSRPVPGPSRDFPGRDSPAGKPSTHYM
jgi:hypothetical protein